jgi:hypothetical protein
MYASSSALKAFLFIPQGSCAHLIFPLLRAALDAELVLRILVDGLGNAAFLAEFRGQPVSAMTESVPTAAWSHRMSLSREGRSILPARITQRPRHGT